MGYNTITEGCFYKTGRKGVVLEMLDMLKPNLFDNNKKIGNDIFHSGSKFRFTIVDSRGSKGKALYYNIDPEEALLLTYLLSDGNANSFKERVGAFNSLKGPEQNYIREMVKSFDRIDTTRFDNAMDYSSNALATNISLQKNINVGGNELLVRKMMISYEEAMNSSSKWKITIEIGKAQKDDKGNGLNIIKYGTYVTTDKSYFMLQANELIYPINEAAKRVILSQGIFYSQMKEAEKVFTDAKMLSADYGGEKIDEWNPKGKAPERKAVPEKPASEKAAPKSAPAPAPKVESEKIYPCEDCGTMIDAKVKKYSTKVHKKALCFVCQKKVKS